MKPGRITFRERFNLDIDRTGTIRIDDGVFVNHDCSLTGNGASKGVTIGDNAVTAAGCVVYKDVAEGERVINKK